MVPGTFVVSRRAEVKAPSGSRENAIQEDTLREGDVVNEYLSNMREMCVRRQDGQAVLHGTGSDPEVIRGFALFPQGLVDRPLLGEHPVKRGGGLFSP